MSLLPQQWIDCWFFSIHLKSHECVFCECVRVFSLSVSVCLPLSMVCWCLAVQMRRLMASITWLFESTSFSFGFLLRKITESRNKAYCKWGGKNQTQLPVIKLPFLFFSFMTTVMAMPGGGVSSPPLGILDTCSERKLLFSVFLLSPSFFFSDAWSVQ